MHARKYFPCLIFGGKGHRQKYFNSENFPNYGTCILIYVHTYIHGYIYIYIYIQTINPNWTILLLYPFLIVMYVYANEGVPYLDDNYIYSIMFEVRHAVDIQLLFKPACLSCSFF